MRSSAYEVSNLKFLVPRISVYTTSDDGHLRCSVLITQPSLVAQEDCYKSIKCWIDNLLTESSPSPSVKSEIRETIATSDFLVPLFFPIELGSGAPDAAEDRDECLYPRIGRSVPNEQSLWSYYGRESNHSCSEERIECAFS